ncbi:related to Ribonuclease T2-like [Saccharomycodes ludwigii]|uniref:Ribonuclease T2-like n=1 Tax=Saccharomycodes ludwigii TaxID=36035 RepID=A0A376B3R7_9ASCO|nr:hypothetical protein SCDLUD_002112 [Saccharomycodes ludwigii]KAH3902294.1 hypothetical protein SCDLUD_002112 [Saccharomycodes ludwigii]SSD59307.1 related to Ribonuclease T2-like [Saccharomycodes ludwigii]
MGDSKVRTNTNANGNIIFIKVTFLFLVLSTFFKVSNGNLECPIDTPLSCSNKTVISDSCCFEYPGGIFLQTQFWDYQLEGDKAGPSNKFTLHGLWPDNCDGSYEQFCDSSLNINYKLDEMLGNNSNFHVPDVLPDLTITGPELLEKMSVYWKSNTGDDSSLWKHEYNKHGTCIKTMNPKCYGRWWEDSQSLSNSIKNTANDKGGLLKNRAVYDYFRISVELFEKLDTYKFLMEGGITPSIDKTYTRDEISSALKKHFQGHNVFFKCDSYGALNEIWYYHLINRGSVLSQDFTPIDSFRTYSNCPISKIYYYPKGYKRHNPTPPGKGRSSVGVIRIGGPNGDGSNGFVIRNGHWMTKGTPANFEVFKSTYGNYYIKSRSGYCKIVKNKDQEHLLCGGGNNVGSATQFELEEKHGYIGYGGKFDWYSNDYPRNSKQSVIYPGSGGKYTFKLKFTKTH